MGGSKALTDASIGTGTDAEPEPFSVAETRACNHEPKSPKVEKLDYDIPVEICPTCKQALPRIGDRPTVDTIYPDEDHWYRQHWYARRDSQGERIPIAPPADVSKFLNSLNNRYVPSAQADAMASLIAQGRANRPEPEPSAQIQQAERRARVKGFARKNGKRKPEPVAVE